MLFFSRLKRWILPLLALCSLTLFAARHFSTDIFFYSDIARDFLLVEDIVVNKNLALIGARASIPGVFHGPLWNYVHVPVFLLTQGDPAAVQIFWFLGLMIELIVLWWIARRWWGKDAAWLALALGALRLSVDSRNLINPAGAVLPLLVFFFLWVRFFAEKKIALGFLAFFFLGMIIQSQMALGGPLFVLALGALMWQVIRHKEPRLLFAPLSILLTTSTFWLFELRNNFPQLRGVLAFISGAEDHGKMLLPALIQNRVVGSLLGLNVVELHFGWMLFGVCALFFASLVRMLQKGDHRTKQVARWFAYFYFGFWSLSFLYGGVVWAFYYAPFALLSILVFVGSKLVWKTKTFALIYGVVFGLQVLSLVQGFPQRASFTGKDRSSWEFHRRVAETVFADAPERFGYYVYTADQYGYSAKYALHFVDRLQTEKKGVSYEKQPVTYLIIEPNTENPFTNDKAWKVNQVKITGEPVHVWRFENGYRVEKYELSPEEVALPDDPLLVDGIQLR